MTESFRVIAIMSAFNEADIISPVIGHLVENGIEVYLIDNRSTDATITEASRWLGRGLLHIESFPPDASADAAALEVFDWTAILQRKEELAQSLKADWFIHHDADEIREGPWPGLTFKEAIRRVDTLGYNCIDFRVINFHPVDDGFKLGDDPQTYFTLYEDAADYDRVQLKAWKAGIAPISLAAEGGHNVSFAGRKAFPIRFLLRHYPIRGQTHGTKKVFGERKTRFLPSERSKGWHVQYDSVVAAGHCFLRDPATLRPFELDEMRLELELTLPDTILQELAMLNQAAVERDRQIASLDQAVAKRDEQIASINQALAERDEQIARLNQAVAERDEHIASINQALAERDEHIASINQALAERDEHIASINQALAERDEQIARLNQAVAGRDQEIAVFRGSNSWRITKPLRFVSALLRGKR